MNRVFVSYSRRNRTFAERLARDLSDAGLDVWVDFRQIHAGEMWEQEIYRGIERCEMVVVCLSPDAVHSEWVQREVNTARELEKVILPVMAVDALAELQQEPTLQWLLKIHFILFEDNYETAFPELLRALPGRRRVGAYDVVDPEKVSNPFKGLEAFQQTDAAFFFGRETLIDKSLARLREDRDLRFLAVVGASGSGKSSLVRAGVLPALRAGKLPNSETWRLAIFTPGERPVSALADRLSPLMANGEASSIAAMLHESPDYFDVLTDYTLEGAPDTARLVLVVDQFEEVFTRASDTEAEKFLQILWHAVAKPDGRAHVLITMRADFFDRLSRYPDLAALFEQENMVIVTEMTPPELLRSIEGPARAAGLTYDAGLSQRILEEVRRQPGSLPLLQYALKELFLRRDGLRLTTEAYEEIGGVQQALAQHAETVYQQFSAAEQSIMRRVMLRLVEVSDSGEATRRRITREELQFRDVSEHVVQELIDELTASESRLLIASRQITAKGDNSRPVTYIEVSHEALIREWERLKDWVADNLENLRLGGEILQAATDWRTSSQDKAYLLTGNRLLRAQDWLKEADASPLQRAFLQASIEEEARRRQERAEEIELQLELQRKANNRQRLFITVLVVAVVISAVLSFIAFLAQQDATRQAEVAEEQTIRAEEAQANAEFNLQRAISLSLSASAQRELDAFNIDQAAALAVNANLVDLDQGDIPAQSEQMLADVVFHPGTRHIYDTDGVLPSGVALSPDGTRAALAFGSQINILDVTVEAVETDGDPSNLILRLPLDGTQGHTENITALAYSPAGRLIASADNVGTIILWDVSTNTPIYTLQTHTEAVNSVKFNANGTLLVSGGEDQQVILWDVTSGTPTNILTNFGAAVRDVAIHPNDTIIAAVGEDTGVRIWNLGDGQSNVLGNETVPGHTGFVNVVTFGASDNTNLLFSGGQESEIIAWNFITGRVIDRLDEHEAPLTSIVYTPSGNTFFTGDEDGVVIWWDGLARRQIAAFGDHVGSITALSVDAQATTLFSGGDDSIVRVWDLVDPSSIGTLEVSSSRQRTQAMFSGDDRLILTASSNGNVLLWDAQQQLIMQQFVGGHADEVEIMAATLSPDAQTLVTADNAGVIVLWRTRTGTPVAVLDDTVDDIDGHQAPVQTITYFDDGTRAVTGAADGSIIIWNLQTPGIIASFAPGAKNVLGHQEPVNDIAVHPSGAFIFSASDDGLLIMWDINQAAAIAEYDFHNDSAINAVDFHSSGEFAISGAANGTVVLWNTSGDLTTREGRESVITRFDAHDGMVTDVVFSPVRSQFASASLSGELSLWDIRRFLDASEDDAIDALETAIGGTGSILALRSFEAPLLSSFVNLDFSNDGQTIVAGLTNGEVKLFRVLAFQSDLLSYMAAFREVPLLTGAQRELFQMDPVEQEVDGVIFEDPYPYTLPTSTPSSAWNQLDVGQIAIVNTTNGDLLFVRSTPGGEVIARLEDGTRSTIVGGPQEADGLNWWQIVTGDGVEGWVAANDGTLQLLVPDGY